MHHLFKPSIYISVMVITFLAANASNSQYQFIPTAKIDKSTTDDATRFANEPPHLSIDNMPDSEDILSAYKNAKTVADIETGNDQVIHAVAKIRSAESVLSHLAATLRLCDEAQLPDFTTLQTTANETETKAVAFEAALTDIERRMKRSIEAMQGRSSVGRFVKDNDPDFKRNEQVRRYQIAYSNFGRLRVQAQELRKSINRARHSILSVQCNAGSIPPLYESERVDLPLPKRKRSLSVNP